MMTKEAYARRLAEFHARQERKRKRAECCASKWRGANKQSLLRQVAKMERTRAEMAGKLGSMKATVGRLRENVERQEGVIKVLHEQIRLLRGMR